MKESSSDAASFYADLVNTNQCVTGTHHNPWVAQAELKDGRTGVANGLGQPSSKPSSLSLVKRPVRFKSSGVHDMSNVQPSAPTIHRQRTSTDHRSVPPELHGPGPPRDPARTMPDSSQSLQPPAAAAVEPSHRQAYRQFESDGGITAAASDHTRNHPQDASLSRDDVQGSGFSETGFEVRAPVGMSRAKRLAQAEAILNAQWQAATNAFEAKERGSAASQHAQHVLGGSNIGFKLLKAAGWKEGAGLGVAEQGIVAPLAAHRNPGQRGLGFDRAAYAAVLDGKQGVGASEKPHQQQGKHESNGKVAGVEKPDVTHVRPDGVLVVKGNAEQQAKRAKLKAIVDAELAGETLEQKLAHHRAVMHAEADAARSKALQTMLFRSFNDPLDNAGSSTANSNPLGRNKRLRKTNPLLDSDDD